MISASRLFSYLPNLLTLYRGGAVFFFFYPSLRIYLLISAALSDLLDGYLARRFRLESLSGRLLDPLMDRLFLISAAFIFYYEGALEEGHLLGFCLRDGLLILFGLYLILSGRLFQFTPRPFLSGKLLTTVQFLLLMSIELGVGPLSPGLFLLFTFPVFIELGYVLTQL